MRREKFVLATYEEVDAAWLQSPLKSCEYPYHLHLFLSQVESTLHVWMKIPHPIDCLEEQRSREEPSKAQQEEGTSPGLKLKSQRKVIFINKGPLFPIICQLLITNPCWKRMTTQATPPWLGERGPPSCVLWLVTVSIGLRSESKQAKTYGGQQRQMKLCWLGRVNWDCNPVTRILMNFMRQLCSVRDMDQRVIYLPGSSGKRDLKWRIKLRFVTPLLFGGI